MNYDSKAFLKGHLHVQLKWLKCSRDIKKWLLSDQQNYDLTDINKSTFDLNLLSIVSLVKSVT